MLLEPPVQFLANVFYLLDERPVVSEHPEPADPIGKRLDSLGVPGPPLDEPPDDRAPTPSFDR